MAVKFVNSENLSRVWTKAKEKFVAKESGKGLSSNDYTSTEKTKLSGIATGATKNDTLYKNQSPSTVAVGGVPKGYVPPTSGTEAVEMINKMLHAYVAPQVSVATKPVNGSTFEIGTTQSVTGADVNIVLGSASITKIEVLDGSTVLGSMTSGVKAGINSITFAKALSITSDKTLSATVTDSDAKTVTARSGSFQFVYPYYYGVLAAGATPTESLVKAGTKVVQQKGNKSFAFTANNQKMFYAYPKTHGNLTKILDANSFDVTGTFTKTELTIGGVAYYVYSNDASTVSGFKMTFNY